MILTSRQLCEQAEIAELVLRFAKRSQPLACQVRWLDLIATAARVADRSNDLGAVLVEPKLVWRPSDVVHVGRPRHLQRIAHPVHQAQLGLPPQGYSP
eukprot:scaffold95905_cov75-Phaeocystis_antarctica.AAC.1